MKIEAGKYYRTRDGRKVGPMKAFGSEGNYRERVGDQRYWNTDGIGHIFAEGEDLIAEWSDLTPHQKSTAEMIKVMQAYVDGEDIYAEDGYVPNPLWNWARCDYRIAPAATPDTIDWSHVAQEFKWMARDEDGNASIFTKEPHYSGNQWYMTYDIDHKVCTLEGHAYYHRGTCDWKDSLVKRPDSV